MEWTHLSPRLGPKSARSPRRYGTSSPYIAIGRTTRPLLTKPLIGLCFLRCVHAIALTLPRKVGLSHMDQSIEKEGFAPSGMEHLVAHALRPGRCLQDVDCELAQDGEVLGGMIFAAAAGVFGEQDIEDPMEIVLDAPMGAH